jgi:hypothetical protein
LTGVSERCSGVVRRHHRHLIRLTAAASVWCGVVLLAPQADAQPSSHPVSTDPDASQRARARELGDRGGLALDAGDYSGAADLFRAAIEQYDFPTLRLYLARSLLKDGRPVAATREYEALLNQPVRPNEEKVGADARDDARKELLDAAARQVRLTVTIEGGAPDGLRLEVSGRSAPVLEPGRECLVEPGTYEVRVTHPDGRNITRSIVLAERETRRLELDPGGPVPVQPVQPRRGAAQGTAPGSIDDRAAARPREAAPVARPTNAPAWVAGWLTAGLAGGAIVTGLLAAERKDDYDDQNRLPDVDAAGKRDMRDKALQMQVLNAAFSVAALIGGGVTLYLIVEPPPARHGPSGTGAGALPPVASGWLVGVRHEF